MDGFTSQSTSSPEGETEPKKKRRKCSLDPERRLANVRHSVFLKAPLSGISNVEVRMQPVTGLTPPQVGEALIRGAWPSVAAMPAVASLGRSLILSIIGAPLGWALMLPFYFKKVLPFIATRYTLTNRRLMIQRGLKPVPVEEVPLSEIEDVRVNLDENSAFFRSGDLEVVSKGQVRLKLAGVPEPEAFRQAILNACMAWVPGKAAAWMQFVPAKK
jgi:hypothetical protein